MRRKAIVVVSIGGVDVTGNLTPYLISITVHDAAGQTSDTATIIVDDSGGQIRLPSKGDLLSIALGWEDGGALVVFEGKIDNVTSEGSRGGGRLLNITAKSADTESKIKENREKHWDDKTLGDVLRDAGQYAGVSVSVHGSLAALRRDYWAMTNQSFAAFGEKLARELGATFKIRGNRAVMVPRNEGIGAAGSALPTVTARVGHNVISWSLTPSSGRPQFESFIVRWYDRREAKWKRERVTAETEAPARSVDRYSEYDSDTSNRRAGSAKKGGDREKGGGTITLDGEPSAQAEAPVVLIGARPGIDGTYRADSVEHHYVRGGGYTTTIEVKQPSGDAGSDDRE